MAYLIITPDQQDDTLVLFLGSQERDHHSHTVNKQRYETMMARLPAGPFRDRIARLLQETNARLAEVNEIIAATTSQMPDVARIEASKTRLRAAGQM